MIERGDVFYAKLPDVGESIQNGVRPVLVVSNNIGNKYSSSLVIVPITSKRKKKMPTHFSINLDKKSVVLCEQLTTVHKSQLYDKLYTLTEEELIELDKALIVSLGIGKAGTT